MIDDYGRTKFCTQRMEEKYIKTTELEHTLVTKRAVIVASLDVNTMAKKMCVRL